MSMKPSGSAKNIISRNTGSGPVVQLILAEELSEIHCLLKLCIFF